MDKAKVTKWIGILNNPSYSKRDVLSAILEECTYDELESIYKRSPNMLKGLLSLSYLKRTSYNQLFTSNVKPRRDLKGYIGVVAYVVKRNAALINKYIEYRIRVERAILTGQYDQARQLIKTINTTISYSYWAATCLIKIARLEKGLKECTDFYNQLCDNNNTITRQIYYCAYRSSSLDFIDEELKRVLVPESMEYSEFVNNFLITHCMPYWGVKEGEWICADTNSSIIDFYNNFLVYLPNLNESTINDPSVHYYLKELNSCINDPYLSKICYLYRITETPIVDMERNAITEAYLKNDFGKVIEKGRPYLEKAVDDIEIQSYYLKSLLHQGGEIRQPGTNSPLIDKIKFYYFSIISHSESQAAYKRRLLNLCRSQYYLQGVRQLYTIVEGIESLNIYNLFLSTWKHTPFNTPLDVCFYADNSVRLEYINTVFGTSDYWNQIFNPNHDVLSKDFYELPLASEEGDRVFNYLVTKWNDGEVALYLRDSVATFLFDQFLRRKQYLQGVCFFVDNRLKDEGLVIGIRENESMSILVDNKDLAKEIPLELSIFAEMVGADADTIYFIYKKYLNQCGVAKASEIVIDGNAKQKYFLENVAVPKVLTLHVRKLKSVRQVMEERSAICTNLYEHFQDKRMNDEISAICRDIKIRELNNQVDESKIFVDVQSIKEHDSQEAQTLFDMFASATNQVAFKDIYYGEIIAQLATRGVQSAFVEFDEKGTLKVKEGPMELVNYRKDVLTQIFYTIRDQFLFNPKYGLDNYLSTRIRHGTLINQLRNHFEERNLVTNTIGGEYTINDYWISKQFKIKNTDALQCIELFKTFSKGIDEIITTIKDSYIQVRTEENNTKELGCFDFDKKHFSDDIESLLLKSTLNTFDSCFSSIVDCLWQRTEKCLEIMREKLNDAQAKMISLLHSLQKDVVDVVGENHYKINDFKDAISYCQNEIQNDFQIVNKWFKKSNYVDFDFTIGQVIDTSLGFIRRNNTYMPNPQVNVTSTSVLQGRYFGPLYDIFHDILNNALDYEKLHEMRQRWIIDVAEEDGSMHIKVSNPIRKDDVESLKLKVEKINKTLDEMLYEGKSRGEGNTGCLKIFNAVSYHLGSSNNLYKNEINENENKFVVNVVIELKPIKK